MGITDHLTCLLRNLYAGQETTVRIGHETKDWSQIEKGVHQGCPPAYLTYRQSTSCEMLGWINHKLESKLQPQICRWHHTYSRKLRTKEPLDESERGEWKSWLKAQHSENKDHGILSHHFMGNRWGNSGNSVRFIFRGSKITADVDCSHEMIRCFLLGEKVMTNLDSRLKSRDITLPTKFVYSKLTFFQ